MSELNFEFFNDWVEKKLGIQLNSYKQKQMQRRIGNIMHTTGAKTLEEYAQILTRDKAARDAFVEHLTINVTEFYRNKEIFESFEETVKQIILPKYKMPKIWSAACSIGAEPYTLAMILDQNQIKGKIVATDIDKVILDKAKAGTYKLAELKNLAPKVLERYFTKQDNLYEIKPQIKKYVTFKRHDLLKDSYEPNCHVIVCRNVTIYFNSDARDEVYQKFSDVLMPGGILFTGATETISNCEQFGLKKVDSFIYQKIWLRGGKIMADDNSVYRDLFFEESDDNLQALNDNILELEQEPDNIDLVNNIFRVAHTLKGMSATMGYDVMTKLTHKMEDIFDLFKSGKLKVTSDHVSLIFKCLDKLQELVDDLRDDKELSEEQITDLWNELDQVEKGVEGKTPAAQAPKEEQASDGPKELTTDFEKVEEADLDVIKKAKAEGYNAFAIAVRIDAGSLLKGPRVFLITEKLDQEGDVIHSEPSTDILEAGDFETDFKLIYLTHDSKEQVEENINSNSEIDQVIVADFDPEAKPAAAEAEVKEVAKKEAPSPAKEAKPKAAPKKAAKKDAHHNNRNQSIRVDLTRLDNFLDLVSELVVYRNQLEDAGKRNNADEVRDSMEQVSRLTSELQDLVLKIRMQQVSVVFSRFPRMIRDLANELKKDMELVIIGEETELDKTVVSELSEPMIHLLRNCADHGIEQPEVREKLGKPRKGKITLAAYQEGNKVIITLEDDGKGLDPEAIKASAERKGINTEGMSEREIQMLVFHPGFSTAKKITDISGRGVGLDAVQNKISELGGSLEMESQVNVGTKVTIKLPLTLSIIQALMISISNEDFAVPLDVVERVVMIKEEDILQTQQQEVYRFQDQLIPIVRTNRLLGMPEIESKKKFAIIVKINKQYYGILADGLIGQQEIVIKKIDQMLMNINKYQGATILGNGSIALILDVNAICNAQKVANS